MWKGVSVFVLAFMCGVAQADNPTSNEPETGQTRFGMRPDEKSAKQRELELSFPTVGVWYAAPLGASLRLGVGLKYKDDFSYRGHDDLLVGLEVGEQGSKQFVALRGVSQLVWMGLDIAHWKTKSNPLVGNAHAEYVGFEAQLMIVRMGLMFPTKNANNPRLTLGIGLSY